MTATFSQGDGGQGFDLLSFTMDQYREAAETLARAIRGIQQGRPEEAKAAAAAVRDMKAAFQLAMEERNRVEKLRREAAGIVNGYAIDLAAAREEVGRRLARLGYAGGD